MVLKEEQLSAQEKFRGHVVSLRVDQARIGDGSVREREVVEHPGGVSVVALTPEDQVLMVRQFRYAQGEVLLELPAGKLERGEDHRPAALRELEEEVGVRAGELIYLGYLYTSPGFSTEVLHMYLARDLEPGVCHPDDDEFLECERIPFDQLVEQVVSGVICDAKTVALVLKAKAYLGR